MEVHYLSFPLSQDNVQLSTAMQIFAVGESVILLQTGRFACRTLKLEAEIAPSRASPSRFFYLQASAPSHITGISCHPPFSLQCIFE